MNWIVGVVKSFADRCENPTPKVLNSLTRDFRNGPAVYPKKILKHSLIVPLAIRFGGCRARARAFDIQMRYQTTVRRELTQMLGQLERIRRNPLPPSPEPVPPHLEPGDLIEIPTAASSQPAAASSTIQAAANPSPEPGDCGSRCSQAADSSAVNEQIGFVSQSPDRAAEPASIHTPKQASGLQRHEQMRAVHPLRPAALPDVLSDEIG
ncbi:MAG: hypothetical protein HYZ57_04525 [Acidobacteria bacterium]|nr:hypothetical protein [Acidobacteriota bacterium]MBI3279091.1 hypothetical protein [Acidobacteriota bacterium]